MKDLDERGVHRALLEVRPDWLDYNGHMNVAYYSLAFDLAGEEFVRAAGMGEDYTRATQNSWMVLEAHITYQNEARLGDRLRIDSRVLDCNAKCAHLYQEMHREDTLLATQEQLVLHVSLATRRGAPFEPAILANFQTLRERQAALPRPQWIGRRIGIRR
ncbi:MAG TPA: thioesterase family protein [Gammaproteobacteria bacterium]|nr:thioesterase family protein [Gammaproteobacteria bacterium]